MSNMWMFIHRRMKVAQTHQNTESDQHSISEPAKKIRKTDHQDQGSCSEESFEDSEDEEFRKRMEAEEKQADSDFDIDFNLSDEEDFCDKTEPENSHNVGVEDVTKEGEIIFKVQSFVNQNFQLFMSLQSPSVMLTVS